MRGDDGVSNYCSRAVCIYIILCIKCHTVFRHLKAFQPSAEPILYIAKRIVAHMLGFDSHFIQSFGTPYCPT
jgi:hypothetical protein